jgi:hypothetical protein
LRVLNVHSDFSVPAKLKALLPSLTLWGILSRSGPRPHIQNILVRPSFACALSLRSLAFADYACDVLREHQLSTEACCFCDTSCRSFATLA